MLRMGMHCYLVPSAANSSKCGVSFVLAQLAPRSPQPKSSARMTMKFGFPCAAGGAQSPTSMVSSSTERGAGVIMVLTG